MQTVIETIASWCASGTVFSSTARASAVDAFTDTIGCMIAGADDPSTRQVKSAFTRQIAERGDAMILGGGRASAQLAALVNGNAAHALEFDDNFHGATTHASAVLVPALIAVAEAHGFGGRRLVEAYLVGLEAQAAIGRGLNPSHYTAGWHSTSTVGCLGTAAGVAFLLEQDAGGIARAISIAASLAGGLKRQFGTSVKPFHAGLAARNAIEAAMLAASGMSGRLDILEADGGFLDLLGGPNPSGWESLSFGERSIIETVGLATKRHPCCGASHRVVDMILELKAAHRFTAGDVERIDALVAIAHARNLAYPDPQDEMQARFSMQYCAAVALARDRLSLADFTADAITRPDIRALLPITHVQPYAEDVERAATGRLPHKLTLRLVDGTVLQRTRQHAKGTLADPLDAADRRAKFLDCSMRALPHGTAEGLYLALQSLQEHPDCSFLRFLA